MTDQCRRVGAHLAVAEAGGRRSEVTAVVDGQLPADDVTTLVSIA